MAALCYLRRHPRTGIYWFRRAVPAPLRPQVGKCEIVGSLRTRDIREARRLALQRALETEHLFQGMTATPDVPVRPSADADVGAVVEAAVLRALRAQTAEAPIPAEQDRITLDEAFRRYDGERKLRPQSRLEFTTALRRFRECVGGDLPVHEVTKAHVRDFKQAMMRMPRAVRQKDQALPLPTLLARYEGQTTARISATTVQKYVGVLQAVLGWCCKNGYLTANPAAGLKPVDADPAKEKRLPYDAGDLEKIFTSALYTGCAASNQRTRPGKQVIKDASYWLPLLGLWTGCRLEEMGQLLIADVKAEGAIWYLDLNTQDDGKSLKTKGSRRRIPLHSRLIGAGFLDHVRTLKDRGETRVFPDLRRNARGKTTAEWSKWWGRYSRQIGISDPRKVFHSLRHAFKDGCRAAQIEEAIHDALTGHTSASVSRSYGSGYPLTVLAQAIEKLDFPGFPNPLGSGITGRPAARGL